jgi:cytochrome c-type biogenesis protein CcmE
MNRGYWIAAALAAAFVVLGVTAFQKTLTPYVSFDEARKARGVVQVMGSLDKESDRYDTGREELSFDIVDKAGAKLPVVYRGIKPANFKDAISIVAIGRYREGRIDAERLLVKCPSKYQGAEVEKSYPATKAGGRT